MTNLVMLMPYKAYVAHARAEGFRVYAIWDLAVAQRIYGAGAQQYLADLAERADEFVLADFDDEQGLREVVGKAVRDFDADHVYHVGQEESMLLAYRLAEERGLQINSTRSIELLNDKLALRQLLAEQDLSPVRFVHTKHWRDVADTLDSFELPVVIKPTQLSGSRAVFLLQDREQLPEWGAVLDSYGYAGPLLVEEYLTGPEYSVETISDHGTHHVLGVTRKLLGAPPLFVEVGHVHPEPESAATRQMADLTVEVLRLTGYRTGPAHTEIKMTPSGPRIVESQARLGGDRIPQLVELATGIQPERAIFRVLAGRPIADSEPRRDAARVHYFSLPRGRVTSVAGLDEIRALPFVNELSFPFRVGDTIPATVDWKTRHGYVVVGGGSIEDTSAHVELVEGLLAVRVAEIDGRPQESGAGGVAA